METNQITSARQRLGLSQAALAERLGVDQATISRWERGVVPVSGPAALALRLLAETKES